MIRFNKDNWQDWLKFILVLLALIFLLIGFLIGYFYGDKSCFENPFVYGVKELNRANSDQISCSCISMSGKLEPFSFDEDGMQNYFLKK